MALTLKNITLGIACIVAANLLLEISRRVVTLPWSDSIESSIATGTGVLAWFFITARSKKVSDAR